MIHLNQIGPRVDECREAAAEIIHADPSDPTAVAHATRDAMMKVVRLVGDALSPEIAPLPQHEQPTKGDENEPGLRAAMKIATDIMSNASTNRAAGLRFGQEDRVRYEGARHAGANAVLQAIRKVLGLPSGIPRLDCHGPKNIGGD